MSRFVLVFDGDHVQSAMGSAWIGVNPQEHNGKPVITHDCGSVSELKRAVEHLKADLDKLVREAEAKFAANMSRKAVAHATRP
jgi:hypothetical protein